MLQEKINSLPKNPGVYIFKDKYSTIIYIGKAKNLKNRVKSYFLSKNNLTPKTQFLVKNIYDLDFIVVDSEIEALLLENRLIKKNKPKYNVNLKDSKTFAYIKITDEKVPKIISTRQVNDKGTYFGPYVDSNLRLDLIKLVNQIFGIITNKTYSTKSELYYQIGLAPAKNLNEIDIGDYMKKVEMAKKFLGGDISFVIKKLKYEMKKASNDFKFEIAAEKKNQINSIIRIKEKQKVDLIRAYDQDVIIMINDLKSALIEIFNISKGVISSKKSFKFDYDLDLFESFIKMYYSKNTVPKEIIVNYEFEDRKLIEEYLSKNRGSKVIITNPLRGEKLRLIELAIKNAKLNLKVNPILKEIKEKLELPKIPNIIECFDISNLGKDFLVGAMVQFKDMEPNKDEYRRFEIKSFSGKNDDFAAMKEVIYRRYKKLKDENLQMPDLIVVDGGKGQLKMAIESLRELNIKIPIIALAKKEEEIFVPFRKISFKFDKNSKMMLFIRSIRDETHRFVISYNRKKRDMRLKDEMKEI